MECFYIYGKKVTIKIAVWLETPYKLVIFCAAHRVIFSLRESDIETYGFSDITFAPKLAKRISLAKQI